MKKATIVAGVMSGTSCDGIDVALLRFSRGRKSLGRFRGRNAHGSDALRRTTPDLLPFELLGHAEFPYPRKVRAAVLAAMNATQARVADLARLNFLLGELYSDAVLATLRKFRAKIDLVGCHGQTLYHQGEPALFLGRRVAATWQTGEAAIIAARVGVPVVSDFRPADMAANGQGAPLVPFLDYMLFRDSRIGRIVQNIGGIANLTAIPAGAVASQVIAFDTGPGNMLIDAATDRLFRKPFDRDGKIARSGNVATAIVDRILADEFFRKKPPKTAGREEFGREFGDRFLRLCATLRKEDVVATATALTASSIADSVRRHLGSKPRSQGKQRFHQMIVSGGGAKNSTLVSVLKKHLAPLAIQLRFAGEFGVPPEAKEAMAFAVMAHQTWHRRPSNVPSATGAKHPAILGKISYP
jgi:anhydro-N-acetylmuramic acid kinase